MGGYAFQSKGCRTCKRCKIKCDEKQLECGRCLKRGLQCEGYDQARIFVYGDPVNPKNAVQPQHSHVARGQSRGGLPEVVAPSSVMRDQMFSSYISLFFPNGHKVNIDIDQWDYFVYTTLLFQELEVQSQLISLSKPSIFRSLELDDDAESSDTRSHVIVLMALQASLLM
ncbi:hypothetical protein N7462_001415 [Penicillium macrosclerotiorum]|uniref:uncharacterized protein n=1 Tax=Penicillium macrosclerotiorum TaxID=303699 RepID=UPI002546AE2D|nr:uncharacterized protein N7462_001415 [Penicillium macrosclerotiorum]KAJ5691992.1 hypothetical protein N7462_001415 [Penicillium macrosclerotiorum]